MDDLWIGYQKLKEENKILKSVIKNFGISEHNFLSAFTIRLSDFTKQVVCGRCYKLGEVNEECPECGGKGVHKKTNKQWVVNKHPVIIVKIDRTEDGKYFRFWTDMSNYYKAYSVNKEYPDGIAYIHFTLDDASNECKRLNERLDKNS